MASDDVDLEAFVHVKGKAKGARLGPTAVASSVAEDAVPLARPQRKVASEQRRLDSEVAREEERGALIRSLTLNGLEAKRQADARARAIAVAAAPKPQPPTVADAYSLAMSCERSAKTPAQEREAVRLWELVYSLAEAGLRDLGDSADSGVSDGLRRAQMTSLCHRAPFYERLVQLRFAINLYERVLVLAQAVRMDAPTRASLVGVLRKLAALHTAVGAVDKAQQKILTAHNLSRQGRGPPAASSAVRSVSATGSDAARPPSSLVRSSSAPEPGRSVAVLAATAVAGAASDSAPTPAPTHAAPLAGAPPTLPASQPTPPSWLAVFDHPSDGSARAAFLAGMREAMLDGSFDALNRLLNRGLLGDRDAQAVLHSALPGVGLTAVMVAAGAGRSDVLRRLLGPLPRPRVAKAALHDRDFAGNNALYHACATGHPAAADELLRALHAAQAFHSIGDGSSTALSVSLSVLGLDAARVDGFPPPLQHLIGAFSSDPDRYIREYRVAIMDSVVPGSARGQAPSHLPSSASPAPLYYPSPQAGFRPLPLGHPGAAPRWMPVDATLAATMAQMQAAAFMAVQAWMAAAATMSASQPPLAHVAAPAQAVPMPSRSMLAGPTSVPPAPVATTSLPAPAPQECAAPPISQSRDGRELLPMALPPANSGLGGLEDSSLDDKGGSPDPWDQFAANKALGVSLSGFKEELYTSVLDRGAFSKEQVRGRGDATVAQSSSKRRPPATVAQIAAADAIAKAILEQTEPTGSKGDRSHLLEERQEETGVGTSLRGGEKDDEEARYSAVSRPAGTRTGHGVADAFTDAGVAARAVAVARKAS